MRWVRRLALKYYQFCRDYYQSKLTDLNDFKNSQSIYECIPDFENIINNTSIGSTIYIEHKVPELRKICKKRISYYSKKIKQLEVKLSQ